VARFKVYAWEEPEAESGGLPVYPRLYRGDATLEGIRVPRYCDSIQGWLGGEISLVSVVYMVVVRELE
jgi:hypothetical protein